MSRNKYNIKIDDSEPKDLEIDKYRNFDRVLSQYKRNRKKRKPLHEVIYKLYRYIPVIIVLILSFLMFAAYLLFVG